MSRIFGKSSIVPIGLWGFVVFSAIAAAQSSSGTIDVRGQLLLPNGSYPTEIVRFYLTSDDGRVNEYRFTDSNGRFVLERLSSQASYTITVDSDDQAYGNTIYNFIPRFQAVIRVTLNPLMVTKTITAKPTVSAASAYKPNAAAAALYAKATDEINKKNADQAEKLLRQAAEADPKYSAAFNDLGVVLMGKKNYLEAEKAFRQALTADPKNDHALLNLGITLNHMGQYTKSPEPLREVLRLQPGLVDAHMHLGIALVETDQFKEAEVELRTADKSSGADKEMIDLYLGKLYARTGHFDESITEFKDFLTRKPQAANAEEIRGLIARMQDLNEKKKARSAAPATKQ